MISKLLVAVLVLITTTVYAKENNNYQTIVESNTATTLATLQNSAKEHKMAKQPIGEIVEWTAMQLLGKPYVPALLDKKNSQEYMFVSLDATDCMLFVEHVLAVSELIKQNKLTLPNLITLVQKERYHGSLAYCNRNHYFKDWALENQHKGLVTDEAMVLTGIALPFDAHVLGDVISQNKNSPHAADLSCIREREALINREKIGFIPLQQLPKYLSAIKMGDIIGIVRTPKGRADSIHHLGIAYVSGGKVGMIDASSDFKRVVLADSLMGYLNGFKDSQGIILLRPKAK